MNKIRNFLSMLERKERGVVLVLAGIVIASGVVYSISLGQTLRYADEHEYFTIANNLVAKGVYSLDGVHPTAFRPPGYPLFLSAFLYLGLNIVHLRIVNFILLAASMYLLYAILRSAVGAIAGIIAAFLVLLYPVLFYTAGTLYPQTLGSFLFLSFAFLVLHTDVIRTKRAILAGFAIGFLILSISTFIIVLLVTLLFLIFRRRDFKSSALVILVSGAMIGGWMVRNHHVFDVWIPFSTNSGFNLLLGNSPHTTANSGVNVDLSAYDAHASTLSEIQKDEYYRSEALRYITENKGEAITLYISKVLNYFNYRNELATRTEASSSRDLLMFLTYVPLLALFILRLCLFKRYPLTDIEVYFVILYIVNAFFQATFFTRIRFRLPYDYVLIGTVAIFLSNIVRMAGNAGTTADRFDNPTGLRESTSGIP